MNETKETTRKKIQAVLESIRNGATITTACEEADIERSYFWKLRKKNKTLEEDVEAALSSRIAIVEDALYKSAVSGNTTAQIFFLQNRAADKWQDKRAYKFEGEVKYTLEHLKDEEIDSLIKSFYAGYDQRQKESSSGDSRKGKKTSN